MSRVKKQIQKKKLKFKDSRKKLIPDNILDDLNVALGDLSEKAKELGKNINDSNLKNKKILPNQEKNKGFVFLNNDYLTKSILFGEDKLVVDSDEFTGANLQATFGELKLIFQELLLKKGIFILLITFYLERLQLGSQNLGLYM